MKLQSTVAYAAAAALFGCHTVNGLALDLNSKVSIKNAASTIAFNMMKYYTGNNTGDNPGNLPAPYFWWEGGGMFGAMVDYWYYTNDTTYNDVVEQALSSQVGEKANYMPRNQTRTEGNDDQGFWGMAAMSAAEMNFQNPSADKPQWLELAQAVFNTQASRWDMTTCGGGLRWQIFPFNNGFEYKNSIANGCFFNIATRLALYTGNKTYADWAQKTWDWMNDIGLIDENYNIYDGTQDTENCTTINKVQWTYNSGIFLHGAAAMYSYTNGSAYWKTHTQGLLTSATKLFFKDGVMQEQACEGGGNCNNDQKSFKAYLSRWLAATTKTAPFTAEPIKALLKTSAVAAAQQCTGTNPRPNTCGQKWTQGAKYDGSVGNIGLDMAALAVVQANLIEDAPVLFTNSTGGTSKGNPNAGSGSAASIAELNAQEPATRNEKVGVAFFTAAVCMSVVGCTFLMLSDYGG